MHDEHDEPEGAPNAQQEGAGWSANEAQVWEDVQEAIAMVMKASSVILEGRYKSIAVTHLETAGLFFKQAIDIDGIK